VAGDVVCGAGGGVRDVLSRWRAALTVSGAKVAAMAIALILSVAIARLLGPSGRGEFILVTTAVALGAQILNFGVSSALALEFARNPNIIPKMLCRCWFATGALAAALAAIGLAVSGTTSGIVRSLGSWWPALSLWIPLQLLGFYQVAAATALGRVAGLSAIELGGRSLATAAGLIALWRFGDRVPPLVGGLVAAELATAISTFTWLRASARSATPHGPVSLPSVSSLVPVALRAYPLLLLPFALVRADLLIVSGVRGAAEAGIYSIAAQIVDLLLVVPSTVAALALPEIVRSKSPQRTVRRLALEISVLCALLALATGIWAPRVIDVVFGRAFSDAAGPLRLLLPGYVLLAAEIGLAQYFAVNGYPLSVAVVWLSSVVVNIVLNAYAVPRFGASGAAVTSTLTYALVAVGVLYLLNRDRAQREHEPPYPAMRRIPLPLPVHGDES